MRRRIIGYLAQQEKNHHHLSFTCVNVRCLVEIYGALLEARIFCLRITNDLGLFSGFFIFGINDLDLFNCHYVVM